MYSLCSRVSSFPWDRCHWIHSAVKALGLNMQSMQKYDKSSRTEMVNNVLINTQSVCNGTPTEWRKNNLTTKYKSEIQIYTYTYRDIHFLNTQSVCSSKSQQLFPKTKCTLLCFQNYITNVKQHYLISHLRSNFKLLTLYIWPNISENIRRVSFKSRSSAEPNYDLYVSSISLKICKTINSDSRT